jgi:hypothetical protein
MSELSRNVTVATVLVALIWGGACNLNDGGLGLALDGGAAGGAGGTAICPAGVIDQASWPAGTTYMSCTQTCGPDDIGTKTCGQTNLATCQAAGGCVCSTLSTTTPTCVTCTACALPSTSACYLPSNAASPSDCATSVVKGGACSPACGKQLCMQADGRTGCVCNAEKKYACASWNGTSWK